MKIGITLRAFLILCTVWLCMQPSGAQPTPRNLAGDAASAVDLVFPAAPIPLAEANYPQMLFLKPEGQGPFPAVVLGHQCGGLVFSKTQPQAANWSMLEWAKRYQQAGYVALLVDFMGPRGAQQVCQGPQNGVTLGRSTQDFFQAAAHLRKFNFVQPDQIALVGFSQGALLALFVNSQSFRQAFGHPRGFDAYVSYYPPCRILSLGPNRIPIDVVQKDIEKPHLFVLAGADNETPASDCEALVTPIKTAGKPVQLHTYPGETHCFDCKSLNGFTKPGRLGTVTYTYSQAATLDSFERTKAFLQETFKTK